MFTFIITPDDGEPYEVMGDSRDISLWERTGRDRSLGNLERNMRISDIESIAHIAAQRHGVSVGTLREFTERNAINVKPPPQSRDLMVAVIDRALQNSNTTAEDIADAVLDWQQNGARSPDPIQPGRSPGS